MLQGHRTWVFENKPVIISTGVVGGPFEAKGKIPEDFDILHEDLWLGQDSYEKAHKILFEEACSRATEKAELRKDDIQFVLAGDLINQLPLQALLAVHWALLISDYSALVLLLWKV